MQQWNNIYTRIMRYIALFILLAVITDLHSQELNCKVSIDSLSFVNMPHYGNNQILYDLLEITSNITNSKAATVGYLPNEVLFNIPIKIWIYHNDDGLDQAITENDVWHLINSTNTHFDNNNANIRFYNKCAFEHVNSTEYNTMNSSDEFENMTSSNRDMRALNWHFVSHVDYPNPDDNWGGLAWYPHQENCFSMAVNPWMATEDLVQWTEGAVAHEVGHTLGLLHTHESARTDEDCNGDVDGKCYQESVSRVKRNYYYNGCVATHNELKCEINGDGLCDTEASSRSITDDLTDCIYNGDEVDLWGDTFTPPENNFMSYTAAACRDEFTEGQVAVMQLGTFLYMAEGGSTWPGINGEPWYNKNILSISGSTNTGETESFLSPEIIEVALDNTYTINTGADANMLAQSQINIHSGFHALPGSFFNAVVETANCDDMNNNKSKTDHSYISNTMNRSIHHKIVDLFLESERNKQNRMEQLNLQQNVIPNTDNIHIYPNPTNSIINIDAKKEIKTVSISNTLGSVVLFKEINASKSKVDMALLTSGIYIIKIIVADGETHIEKIIKE